MEYRRKCYVCGKIYCYTDKDLKDNTANAFSAFVSGVGTVASALGGTRMDMYALGHRTDRYADKIIDYNKCPYCNSTNTTLITDDQWKKIKEDENNTLKREAIDAKRAFINSNASEESLLKRTCMFIEDQEWNTAEAYCEQILDFNPECAQAYVYKLMIDNRITRQDDLSELELPLSTNKLFIKALSFADDSLSKNLNDYNDKIITRNNDTIYRKSLNALISTLKDISRRYDNANFILRTAKTEVEYLTAKGIFDRLGDYYDSRQLSKVCENKATEVKNDNIYEEAMKLLADDTSILSLNTSINKFESIPGWKDADAKKVEAEEKLNILNELKEKNARSKRRICTIVIGVLIVFFAICISFILRKCESAYEAAYEAYISGDMETASSIYSEISFYRQSSNYVLICDLYTKINNISSAPDKTLNITEIYKTLNALDGIIDTSVIYDMDIMKEAENLHGTWKLTYAECNGIRNEAHEKDIKGYLIKDGRVYELSLSEEGYSWDLYYIDGVFSLQKTKDRNDYRILLNLKNGDESTLILENCFTVDNSKYLWKEKLVKE